MTTEVMKQVRTDMTVVDVNGDEVGTVESVRMGDPGAVTTEGQGGQGDNALVDVFVAAVGGGSEIPRQRQEQLVRVGFLKIDNSGVLSGDSYVGADQVDRVAGDTVHLAVGKDELSW